jgi:xanthine dehydrogenase accessory factor
MRRVSDNGLIEVSDFNLDIAFGVRHRPEVSYVAVTTDPEIFEQFLNKADELLAKGEPFAVALVVRYEAPISGKPGNKAIIRADGKLWGWIGGGCAQPVIVKQALQALADGQPRLVRISPSSSPEEGIVGYTMTCHSGGTLDIYIEPVLPKPHC